MHYEMHYVKCMIPTGVMTGRPLTCLACRGEADMLRPWGWRVVKIV
jgi:hypothetical protein